MKTREVIMAFVALNQIQVIRKGANDNNDVTHLAWVVAPMTVEEFSAAYAHHRISDICDMGKDHVKPHEILEDGSAIDFILPDDNNAFIQWIATGKGKL